VGHDGLQAAEAAALLEQEILQLVAQEETVEVLLETIDLLLLLMLEEQLIQEAVLAEVIKQVLEVLNMQVAQEDQEL
jgi:hypothetical protein